MEIAAAKKSVIQAGHMLVERGLVSRTWGNVSCRIDENRFAITPSGMGYDRITEQDIVVVDARTLDYEGTVKPSSEKGVHAAAYRLRPDVCFVIHTHQACATAMSLPGARALALSASEHTALGGDVLRAGYGLPGSKRLWHNVENKISQGASTVLMERHGALVLGNSMEEAFMRAELLERVCERSVAAVPSVQEAAPLQGFTQSMLAALRQQLPNNSAVIIRQAPVFCLLQTEAQLPAMIDDFAQMAGRSARIITPLLNDPEQTARQAARALRGRNCVLLKGVGAVCCDSTPEDAEAVYQLAEKNALTYLTAKAQGGADPLPLFDTLMMRAVYKLKYSKKK
ncbi:MAG: class II aldolase/adducin family protein [Eubacteriales bacterium]|nr:class II aldolase/adducin family protein [Eubacteriales bacterium]